MAKGNVSKWKGRHRAREAARKLALAIKVATERFEKARAREIKRAEGQTRACLWCGRESRSVGRGRPALYCGAVCRGHGRREYQADYRRRYRQEGRGE